MLFRSSLFEKNPPFYLVKDYYLTEVAFVMSYRVIRVMYQGQYRSYDNIRYITIVAQQYDSAYMTLSLFQSAERKIAQSKVCRSYVLSSFHLPQLFNNKSKPFVSTLLVMSNKGYTRLAS